MDITLFKTEMLIFCELLSLIFLLSPVYAKVSNINTIASSASFQFHLTVSIFGAAIYNLHSFLLCVIS